MAENLNIQPKKETILTKIILLDEEEEMERGVCESSNHQHLPSYHVSRVTSYWQGLPPQTPPINLQGNAGICILCGVVQGTIVDDVIGVECEG